MRRQLLSTGVASGCDSEGEGTKALSDLAGGDRHQHPAGERLPGAPGVGRAALVAVLADGPLGAEVAEDDVRLRARRQARPLEVEGSAPPPIRPTSRARSIVPGRTSSVCRAAKAVSSPVTPIAACSKGTSFSSG